MELSELKERQSWSLAKKIDHSLFTIETFLSRLDNKAYVAFSGGKDSTVLYDLCKIIKPDIKAVFCNTGNEYPDIVKFVKWTQQQEGNNVEIIHPKITCRGVMAEYGFPLISKMTSQKIKDCRKYPNSITSKRRMGLLPSSGGYTNPIPKRWMYLLNTEYNTSDMCCTKLKKEPLKKYEKETGLHPIMGIMACESDKRTLEYTTMRGGCNVFRDKCTNSHPLSIWLEDDVWAYIKDRNLKIADIYSKGADRTGCMFCGYGCQFADDNRLKLCYDLYPKIYNIFMNYENNGHTYREALRKVLSKNGLYLPDEEPNIFAPNEDGSYLK